MTSGQDSVEALLRQYDFDPLPAAERWSIGKRAERLAEESGDVEQLYAIRMRLVESAHLVADARAQLALFLWCAYKHDSDPKRFPTRPVAENPHIDLLWSYKWLTGMMCAWPQYSLAQVRSAIDMMRKAYTRAGVGRAGVLWAEFHLAQEAGSDAEIRDALAKIRTTPIDEYSNCDACSRASEINAMAHLGEEDRALALFDELMASGDTCAEEPETIVSECLGLLLHSGRSQQAVMLQERSYPRIMSGPGHIGAQCQHMMFFLATGNSAQAYELFSRHVSGLWHDGLSPATQLGALTSFIKVATLLSRAGHGHLPVPGSHTPEAQRFLRGRADVRPEDAGPYTVDAFVPHAHARAADLAAAFDARNGHTRSVDALAAAVEPQLDVVKIDLGGSESPESVLGNSTTLIPASDVEDGTFREWMDLAYEIKHMEGVSDAGQSVVKARSIASTPAEFFESTVYLLQVQDFEGFSSVLEEHVAFLRERGDHEYADALHTYGWRLWRPEAPAEYADGTLPDPPVLDPVTAISGARSPMWRLELALALIHPLAVFMSSKFENWDESDPEFLDWDREASQQVETTLRMPRPLWEEHAHTLHAELLETLRTGELPSWHFLMAYALAHARLTDFDFTVLEALRCGNNSFSEVPPACLTLTRLLTFQADRARAYGSTSLELTALWGLTTVAVYSGSLRERSWDTRIEELVREVHHPYLSILLRCDAGRTAQATGDHARALAHYRDALVAFDSCEHLRARMSAVERTFVSRARLTELYYTAHYEAGNVGECLAAGASYASELRKNPSVRRRDYRLVEVLQQCATLGLETGAADIYAIIEQLNEASEVAAHSPEDDDDWALLRIDVKIAEAHVAAIFNNGESCVETAKSAADGLEALPEGWDEEVSERLVKLAQVVHMFDPTLARIWLISAHDRGL